jgi:hypothetical protein
VRRSRPGGVLAQACVALGLCIYRARVLRLVQRGVSLACSPFYAPAAMARLGRMVRIASSVALAQLVAGCQSHRLLPGSYRWLAV